ASLTKCKKNADDPLPDREGRLHYVWAYALPPTEFTAMASYFLGVDGGASKTAALVTDEQGSPLGRGLAGGSNHLRVGIETATRNIERAVNIALVEAGVAIKQVEYAYCGIAGSDHPDHHERVVESLRIFFPGGNFIVDTDARIALTGAIGFGAGVVVISGTGSVAFGRNDEGSETRAGGWGPTLGDEGSGYGIARDGLAAIVRAHDGRGPATRMTEMLCFEYGMCDPGDLPRFVYAATTHADDIARYGKVVMDAAGAGDAVAREILERAGRELAQCVLAVAAKLQMTETAFPVAYVGGAFHAGELLLDPMRRVIAEGAARAHLVKPQRAPVEGAAMMAIQAAQKPRQARRG
ncbi:MAG TPA: BadF/BadG/BcrA/BcrD ATPase family protein, partial [Thermoanaerobaculia bacterium]|nr:BadF/BadG/BcrA/BcrD ATPase family protein [Thermoanaerobaculia bacterium]